MSYQTLNADCIVETLHRLEHRIGERFPGSSLAAVCRELIGMAGSAQQRAGAIASPHYVLRAAVFAVIAAGIAGLLFVAFNVNVQVGTVEIFSVFQGVEAAMNIVVLSGAMLFFLGWFGGHNFYLGRTGVAVAQLILTLTIIGSIITIVWVLVDAFLIPSWVRQQNNLLAAQLGA